MYKKFKISAMFMALLLVSIAFVPAVILHFLIMFSRFPNLRYRAYDLNYKIHRNKLITF